MAHRDPVSAHDSADKVRFGDRVPMDARDETIELLQAAYRYAISLTAHPEEAEDLVHDSWLRVVERYGNRVDRALIFRTIRNLFIDRYRRAKRFPSEPYDEYSDRREIGESSLPDVHGDRALHQALARLGDNEREILFLAVVEGYTMGEIARLTDTPRGTVLSLVHRSRIKLRRWLNESDAALREGPWPRLVIDNRKDPA